ncbi:MAG TPA: AAA family ATPase, partial [Candidatus Binatia bacterium]|nr:AAA family ATPase [Candidatus Binatia bacterium]
GHLAKYLGDGLLVYFGYPVAHEDDAQRAVRTGLGIVGAIHELPLPNIQLQHPLQIRVGIHTGLVVAGEMGAGDTREPLAIVGETPNIAARLQEIAEPNTVVISSSTYRLTQGYFACQDLGPRALKGVSAPLGVYRVLGESGVRSRLEVAATAGLTPLVGREEEVRLLLQRWEQVKEGLGQVVLLSGEPGIGKSRLVQVLKERMAGEVQMWLECRCSPYYQNTTLYPLIDLLQRVLGFKREDSPEEKLRKLEAALEDSLTVRQSGGLNEVVPLFASLLSLPLPEGRYPPLTLTPQRQKQKTLEALLAWLLAAAARQPLPFVVEDLHWADPSTLEFLGLLVDQVPTARILTLLAFRPEFSLPWPPRAHMSQITLTRLPRKQVREMVKSVVAQTLRPLRLGSGQASTSSGRTESELGRETLPVRAEPAEARTTLSDDLVDVIVARTDGVPLFVEELTKTVVESVESIGSIGSVGSYNRMSLPAIAIPATLQDSLMARLDRLGPAKEVAQLGATLGREFSYELIQAVSPLGEATLQQALAKLVTAEVLYQRGLAPQVHYLFKHALIQDAAYQSLLKSTRQHYHQQIARMLEERFPETKELQPEVLAHHYTEAGLIAWALPYWQRAGERAIQHSAYVEAISHLTTGLELLKTLSPTPELVRQELGLQTTLGSVLMAAKGYSSPEAGQAYARARELCQQTGESAQLCPVLHGLWGFYVVRAEYRTSYALAEQLLSLAESQHDTPGLMAAHFALGSSSFQLGELTVGRAHWEQGLALYNLQGHRSLAFVYGQDPGVTSRSWTALALWQLGYPDQALKSIQAAVSLAQEVAHPYSLAYALTCAAWSHQLRREEQRAQEQAEAGMALSTEHGIPIFLAMSTIHRGWALAEQGQGEEGIVQLRQGLAAFRAIGASEGQTYYLALLAEAQRKAGRAEDGLSTLAEALTAVHNTGERVYEAELYRLKGQLTLQFKVQGPKPVLSLVEGSKVEEEAEEYFHRAIAIARQQGAKSLELRAAMSLARLWQQQGKKNEARQMLAEIYNWFTEGFDTADLQDAKVLLEELK